jgi:ABC-2 type transport system ATP-binding protein
MSGGMKRRLNIACGIAHKPELIIMDEPTVGVDARSRDHILQSIRALRDEGATIIYTSHYMPEVQALADRVAIIDRGRLAAIGTEKELLEYVTDRKALVIGTESKDESVMEAAASDVRMLAGVKRAQYVPDASELRLDVDLGLANIMPILKLLMERSVTIRTIAEDAPNLETTFLALTGSELNTDSANALPNEQGQSAYFPPKGGK